MHCVVHVFEKFLTLERTNAGEKKKKKKKNPTVIILGSSLDLGSSLLSGVAVNNFLVMNHGRVFTLPLWTKF